MANQDRLYKNKIVADADPESTFIKVDSTAFKRPVAISASDLGKILRIDNSVDLTDKNVSAVKFSGQDADPNLPPEEIEITDRINIAIDDNYLYIWVPSLGKWKRVMLSDWPNANLPDPDQ